MKFNLNTLKNIFKNLSKSPVDDLVKASAKSNVDDVAMGALDVVDDIPKPIDVDDFEAWRKRTFEEAPPVPPPELPKFNSTPDYEAMDINPLYYGQDPNLIDSVEFPDGFKNPYDFAHYYEDLERGFATEPSFTYTNDFGRKVTVPKYFQGGMKTTDKIIVDGKPFSMPAEYSWYKMFGPEAYDTNAEITKASIIQKYVDEAALKTSGISDVMPYANGRMPLNNAVYSNYGTWIPHNNEALAKFYKKNGRLPKGLNSDDFDDFWFVNTQPFKF